MILSRRNLLAMFGAAPIVAVAEPTLRIEPVPQATDYFTVFYDDAVGQFFAKVIYDTRGHTVSVRLRAQPRGHSQWELLHRFELDHDKGAAGVQCAIAELLEDQPGPDFEGSVRIEFILAGNAWSFAVLTRRFPSH